MLEVKIIMNSVMEEILAFKCCNLPDQNLEMHVNNAGDQPVTVPGRFVLENEKGRMDCSHLFPPWPQKIEPGDGAAFYCSLDESVWRQYSRLTIFDIDGNAYSFYTGEVTDYGVPG